MFQININLLLGARRLVALTLMESPLHQHLQQPPLSSRQKKAVLAHCSDYWLVSDSGELEWKCIGHLDGGADEVENKYSGREEKKYFKSNLATKELFSVSKPQTHAATPRRVDNLYSEEAVDSIENIYECNLGQKRHLSSKNWI